MSTDAVATIARPSTHVPGPPGNPIWGNLAQLERDALGFLTRAHREYGDIVRLRAFRQPVTLLIDPAHVQRVLQERHTSYDKDTWDFRMLKPFLGESLLTTDGKPWLRRRRLMQPAFHRQRLQGFGRVMTEQSEHVAARWEQLAHDGTTVDMAAEMSRFTLDVVTACLFGTDVDVDAADVGRAVGEVNASFMSGLRSPLTLLAIWLGRPIGRIRRPMGVIDRVVHGIIARRRASTDTHDDLLAMLMEARDEETGEPLSDRELRNEVLTLFVAGHETTSNALAWTWYLLSTHPEIAAQLREHLTATLGGRAATMDDLPHLDFTRMVIDESMRLYPPAWATSRNPVVDDEIGGILIPARSLVLLSPYLTHRHPGHWHDPETFDPERFRPERAAERHRFAYFPFGGGPHLCIGESFALTEATLALATLAQRFDATVCAGHEVTPEPMVTLRPRGGLPMSITSRS